MGIKSTIKLTREQAEFRYVQAKLNLKRARYEAKAKQLSDEELEKRLEKLNDDEFNLRNGTTEGGLDNYVIEVDVIEVD